MNRHDVASGLFWLGLSIFVLKKALDLGIGVFSAPGAGFVLFWSSAAFGCLSIVLIVKGAMGRGGARRFSDSWRGLKWHHALIAIIALFLYALLLVRGGFLLVTFAFMILLYLLGKVKLWVSVAGAFITIMIAYILFHFALQIQFPRGVLGW